MGASGWWYNVPYQDNIEQALQELRQQVFQQGDFYNWRASIVSHLETLTQEEWQQEREEGIAAVEAIAPGALLPPSPLSRDAYIRQLQEEQSTIESLIEDDGTGTHSILDIRHIGTTPDFGIIVPLPEETMLAWWKTTKPTQVMVERKIHTMLSLCRGWSGMYIIVYRAEIPTEIFFGGYSGD